MIKSAEMIEELTPPEGVSISLSGDELTVKGPKGTLSRTFFHPKLKMAVAGDNVKISTVLPRKKERALFGTWRAHVKNMFKGTEFGFEYKMKIVYAHFPIKASVKGNEFVIENFLGEKYRRMARIMGESKVKTSGDEVIITGHDIENVSQTAANIEQATKIKRYDPRVFQDGIYITGKGVANNG